MLFKVFVTIWTLVLGVNAWWRMECHSRVGLARVDPLINLGSTSQHVHAIHGSSGFSETATYEDLVAGNCTSCAVTEDMSAYWHPAMYFKDAKTNTFELVDQVGGMLAYYLLYPNAGETKVTAFPKGFRMIAGDNRRETYDVGNVYEKDPEKSTWAANGQTTQADLKQRAVGFNCLNYNKVPEGSLARHFMPDKGYLDANCAQGIRLELMFPSCWNGKDLDSANHMDHMAYPDLVMTGTCPPDFPVRLPSLFYEVIWNTAAFNGRDGQFVISNGDTKGFSYHGDFIMGWDENFLQQAINTCTKDSGMIQDCPLFTIQDQGAAAQCNMKVPGNLASEKVDGKGLLNLPGNVPLEGLPGSAPEPDLPGSDLPAPASSPVPTQSYSPGAPTGTDGTLLPGQAFKELSSSSSELVPPPSAPAPTPEAPAPTPPPAAPNMKAVSTGYVTAGGVVSEIVWEEEVVYVTEEVDVTTTLVVTPTPGAQKLKRRAHMHRHQGRHGGRH